MRDQRAGPVLRQAVRCSESRPVYLRIGKALALLLQRRSILPKSALGIAIRYILGLWPRLGVFLRDGRVEADTNLVENAIRPSAIGKKNCNIGDASTWVGEFNQVNVNAEAIGKVGINGFASPDPFGPGGGWVGGGFGVGVSAISPITGALSATNYTHYSTIKLTEAQCCSLVVTLRAGNSVSPIGR